MTDNRRSELLQLVAEDGLTLPYPPDAIIAYENQGAVVDLITGAIYHGLADTRPPHVSPLPAAMVLQVAPVAVAGG